MKRQRLFAGTTRLEAFSDGVFAIAATLLVLDLSADTIGAIHSNAQMWTAVGAMWEKFLAFGISFLLLSMLWVIHVQQFRSITSTDERLLWLNNFRLLFIVLIPFTTSLSSEYQQFVAGRVLLPINFFCAALFGYFSWLWASSRNGHLMNVVPDGSASPDGEETTLEAIRSQKVWGLSAVVCGAVSVALSPFIGSMAFLAYALETPARRLLKAAFLRSSAAAKD